MAMAAPAFRLGPGYSTPPCQEHAPGRPIEGETQPLLHFTCSGGDGKYLSINHNDNPQVIIPNINGLKIKWIMNCLIGDESLDKFMKEVTNFRYRRQPSSSGLFVGGGRKVDC
jgi:hypothetical protein